MLSSSSSSFACHRYAIAINNTGVSLLERGMYDEGFKVMRDAVQAMQGAYECTEKVVPQQQHHDSTSAEVLRIKLQHAMCHLFSCPLYSTNKSAGEELPVKVLSYQDAGMLLQPLLSCWLDEADVSVTRGRRFPFISPIRIEVDHMAFDDQQDLEIGTVIVLYNFATACLGCLNACDPSQSDHFLDVAVCAHSLVLESIANVRGWKWTNQHPSGMPRTTSVAPTTVSCCESRRALLVLCQIESLTLAMILPVLRWKGDHCTANKMSARLRALLNALQELEVVDYYCYQWDVSSSSARGERSLAPAA